MICLDTSFLIRSLVPGAPEGERVHAWLAGGEPLTMNTVAWAEFICGPLSTVHRASAELVVPVRVPFSDDDAGRAADLFNATGRKRALFMDRVIAATALRLAAPLATANRKDFVRFVPFGLQLVTQ